LASTPFVCDTRRVGKSSLGRVLDPGALDASTGPRARLAVEVPAAWLAEGAELLVTAPARLPCARCDGGGCDACARSGALRAPESPDARVVRASIPPTPRPVALRIPHPFGPDHAIEQLLLELRAGAAPSACVTRVPPPPKAQTRMAAAPRRARPKARGRSATPARGAGGGLPWSILVAAVVAAALFALLGR
jgi:hypothetical protein